MYSIVEQDKVIIVRVRRGVQTGQGDVSGCSVVTLASGEKNDPNQRNFF
jgi:hypothetical protein